MHDCNRKKSKGEAVVISTPFTLFKPRQVILKSMSNINTKPLISLSEEQRKLLLQSICQFLQQSGFSKSLKKLHKEADVEKESWKRCSLNLEEMCYQFLKLRDGAKVNDEAIKEKATNQKDGCINGVGSVEKENEGDISEVENHPVDDVGLNHKKKKKKSKRSSDSSVQIAEENDLKPSEDTDEVSLSAPSEPEKKSKDKKKKKHKDEPQEEKIEDKLDESPTEEASDKSDVASKEEKKENSKSKKKKEDTSNSNLNGSSVQATEVDKEKRSSKKRKKSTSDENETDSVEKVAHDDSKRRKTENLDESNETILPNTPNSTANEGLVNGETKESQKKDKKKLQNSSAEPRTSANAFRRVKEEEVEFVDERLQDNSYWAKDGAEIGYGAKAQEVLGQVRGRGFRHEKTKKKRGSYRGGQIDLQSHSIKFNYDDEE